MFYSRKINPDNQNVEVWKCEWPNKGTGLAKKEYLLRIGDEDELEFSHDTYCAADAVCQRGCLTTGSF
jgi:hypothetical protein